MEKFCGVVVSLFILHFASSTTLVELNGGEEDTCFARTYPVTHLDANPKQAATYIEVRLSPNLDADLNRSSTHSWRLYLQARAKVADSFVSLGGFSNSGTCNVVNHFANCASGEGSYFDLQSLNEQQIQLKVTPQKSLAVVSDTGVVGPLSFASTNVDNNIYKLDSVPCDTLILKPKDPY